MESPTGIIPEELMYPEKKKQVLQFLSEQFLEGKVKAKLYGGWLVTVGLRGRGSEFGYLKSTGTDAD